MNEILLKLVLNQQITESDLEYLLYEMCENEHSSCNDSCLVYRLNYSEIPNKENSRYGCDCFKNGTKIKEFIRNKQAEV